MQEESISILPAYGYQGRSNQSSEAIAWLELEQMKVNPSCAEPDELKFIRTATNGGEVQFGGYFLDGYLDRGNGRRRAYEYLG